MTAVAELFPDRRGELDLDAVNEALEDATAQEIVQWAWNTFAEQGLVMTSSFGAQSAVMLHLVATCAPGTPVIFLDTGYLFPETYRFARDLQEQLGLDLRVFSPRLSAAHHEALFGRLWEKGEEGLQEYLRVHKVEPMQRALDELDPAAWFAGLRREQNAYRSQLRAVERQNGRLKVHPILRWTDSDLDAYMTIHELPLHPLVAKGYRSIGDVHSTFPTAEGQDPRSGRVLGSKSECGIHLSEEANRSLTSSKL